MVYILAVLEGRSFELVPLARQVVQTHLLHFLSIHGLAPIPAGPVFYLEDPSLQHAGYPYGFFDGLLGCFSGYS